MPAKIIDAAVAARYQGFNTWGELSQLAHLFDRSLLTAIRVALTPKNNAPFSSRTRVSTSVKISIGWIDKKPYADMTLRGAQVCNDYFGNPITRPVELGDAAIFCMDALTMNGRLIRRSGRGLIVQAKVAPSANCPDVPVTSLSPTNPDKSTNKELALLSSWPAFNLDQANNFRGPLGAFALAGTGSPPAYGWYAAAPGSTSTGWDLNGQWRSRWMCGAAAKTAACSSTFGELLVALFSASRIGGDTVGVPCSPTTGAHAALHASPPVPTDWDRLCTVLINLPKKYEEISGPHGIFPSLPYIPGLAAMLSGSAIGHTLACKIWKDRYPVIIITRTVNE